MAYGTALRGRHFTAVSGDAARHFRRYCAPWAEIEVVPNGLPDTVFKLAESRSREHVRNLTFATNLQGWSTRKNAAAALRAFEMVRRQQPGARLLMFGKDYESDGPAAQWAVQHGAVAGVTFVGFVPYSDLLCRIAEEIDVLVHPSLDESFSMASLEAMALRKPVIAGVQTPGVREVLGYGSAGVLVDVRSSRELADAMLSLANDTGERKRIADAAYERALDRYRLDAVWQTYEELYGRVVRGTREVGTHPDLCKQPTLAAAAKEGSLAD